LQENSQSNRLVFSVFVLAICRVVIDMTRRFAYPFIPEISRQLGVPTESVQTIIGLQSGVGVASPAFGSLTERYGRKRMMMGALWLVFFGGISGALLPRFWLFALVMVVFGISKMIYGPAMQAYLGDRVPYHRRGMAFGATELSWAGSLIIAAPMTGFLLARYGLQAVFLALALVSLIALGVMWRYLVDDTPQDEVQTRPINPLLIFTILRHNRAALGAVVFTLALVLANEVFFINYGLWMEEAFGLSPQRLGAVTNVIPIAEVIGEFLVIGISDRIGKRRLALIGAGLASLGYFALPFFSGNLLLVMAGLFIIFLAFETAVVASIPLFSEVAPESRAVMMSGNMSAASIGRFGGAALGGQIFALTDNFTAVCVFAGVIGALAFFALWIFVHE